MMRHLILDHAWETGEPLLIGYLPAGFPDRQAFSEAVSCCAKQGLAFLEIGIPTPDPYLDGQVIREAMSQVSVTQEALPYLIAETLQETHQAGIHSIAMLYNETLEMIGIPQLAAICEEGHASAILVPNISDENRSILYEHLKDSSIEIINFIGFDKNDKQILDILQQTTGFIYLQAVEGSTGGTFKATEQAKQRLDAVKQLAAPFNLPVALGFGINSADKVAEAAEIGADAAIIGTAFVKAAAEGTENLLSYVEQFSPYLKKKEEEAWTI